jgi:hypothetical protein
MGGATGVALSMQGPWVLGVLINNQWSVDGWGEEKFDHMLLQLFVNYNLPREKSRRCVDGAAGRRRREALQVAKQPINVQLQAFGNVANRSSDGIGSCAFRSSIFSRSRNRIQEY